jgi:acetyl-CoA acetyltransferase
MVGKSHFDYHSSNRRNRRHPMTPQQAAQAAADKAYSLADRYGWTDEEANDFAQAEYEAAYNNALADAFPLAGPASEYIQVDRRIA